MKKCLNYLLIIVLLAGTSRSLAQVPSIPIDPNTVLRPYEIQIAYNKTTTIIFPNSIKSVDRGSADVLAQRAEGVENVLHIKADKEGFEQTNLSVITSDGKFYSFLLNYNKNPSALSINLNLEGLKATGGRVKFDGTTGQVDQNAYIVFEDVKVSDATLKATGASITKQKRFIKNIGEDQNHIHFALEGIYIKDNVIYYQLVIKNNSNINYDIDFIKFYVRDKKLVKRTATQDIEVPFIYEYNPEMTVKGKSELQKVFALQKFTIPDDKDLYIELYEKNGGRQSKLKIGNDLIVSARQSKTL